MSLNRDQRQQIIELLDRGEELPLDFRNLLFPPERREYELVYADKTPEQDVIANTMAVPLQLVRTFGEAGQAWTNRLIFGDNLQVMKTLLEHKRSGTLVNADGSVGVRLVYIDPPFATQREFRGNQDQKAYQDKIAGATFVEFLRKRLILIRELLAEDGSVYIHLDWRKSHYVKTILDEVFGEGRFQSEIIWQRHDPHNDAVNRYGRIHDVIYWYSKSETAVYNYREITDDLSEAALNEYKLALTTDGKIIPWTPDLAIPHRRFKLDDCTVKGADKSRQFTWRGSRMSGKRVWPFSSSEEMDDQVRRSIEYLNNSAPSSEQAPKPLLYLPNLEKGAKRCRVSFLDDRQAVGQLAQDIWLNLGRMKGGSTYPTEKPEILLERIVRASSKTGDIVLDAFAGSGTTCAVAEKLGRRWIGIDSGKLSIYSIQKRMLNLRDAIGNKRGKTLKIKPFNLYNAGLYDFSTLKQLPWEDWRFFALQLFECKDERHKIGGMQLDGRRRGASVLVFNHHANPGHRIGEDTVQGIHAAIGKKVGSKFFIIAPKGVFDFQQDYLDFDDVRYYALRIPYSFINELHQRGFTALKQPGDENAVNDIVDAHGFDFIRLPSVKWEVGENTSPNQLYGEGFIRVHAFESFARLRGKETSVGREGLSMLMLDFDYQNDVFDLDAVFYAHELEAKNWEVRMALENIGERVMAVFIDIHGNEARVVIPREQFSQAKASKPIIEAMVG